MRKTIGLFLILLFPAIEIFAQAPHWTWARGVVPTNALTYPFGTTTDGNGNTFIAGCYILGDGSLQDNQLDFGNGSIAQVDLISGYIVKYDSAGVPVWIRASGGSSYFVSCTSDGNGGIYAGGIGWSPTVALQDSILALGASDNQGHLFIAHYSAMGELLWTRSMSNPYTDQTTYFTEVPVKMSSDDQGNLLVTGLLSTTDYYLFNGDTIQGSPTFTVKYTYAGGLVWSSTSGGCDVTPTSDGGAFICGYGNIGRISNTGAMMWTRSLDQMNITGFDFEWTNAGLTSDQEDNVYVGGGFFSDSLVLGNTVLQHTLIGSGIPNIFLAKLNADGEWQWARNGGEGHVLSLRRYIDGNVVIAGYIGNAGNDTTAAQLNALELVSAADGQVIWQIPSCMMYTSDAAVDPDGSISVSGAIYENCNLEGQVVNSSAIAPTDLGYLAGRLGQHAILGIKEDASKTHMASIYPIPVNETATLELPHFVTNTNIDVFDICGNLVYRDKFSGSKYSFCARGLAPGCYICKVSGNDYRCNLHIVVE